MIARPPSRGEVWLVDLNPTRGREQSGVRPCLVLSADTFNYGPADLVTIVPLTTKRKKIRLRLEVSPPEGGLRETSYIKTDNLRTISKERLVTRWGAVTRSTMSKVEDLVRALLDL
jgi:mRNA interferase MazF